MELVKGFKDFTGEEAEKRQRIKGILAETFKKYGFELADTPIIEEENFVRGENNNDEAVSDVYRLKDKGNRELALRYEFTFQLKRIVKNKKLPYKRYQIGEVFRDEPSNSRRFRQFTQCDIDIVGMNSETWKDEAEILAIAKEVLNKLDINYDIYIGNRKLINEILEEIGIKANKEQILREIDKLDKIGEKEIKENLKKLKAEKLLSIFKKPEIYFKKYKAYKEIEELKKICKYYNLKINFQPSLVRGLSYYNGNVFEIKSKDIRETICAGGSYVINNIQSTGISFGLDRLAIISKVKANNKKILVLSIGEDKKAVAIAQKLRDKGENIVLFYGKPTRALDYANSYGINKVIFVGKEEIKKGKMKIKDMETGKEKYINISKL
ncbi:MAG: ATP phosphoribosyltransferase regulatory subunit [Candidatus Pacearchaeota archaeon]|nr:ATP phosphoribosyltransferase regulatory subunit [Candidatus Pacearchaeota archaeon]